MYKKQLEEYFAAHQQEMIDDILKKAEIWRQID